ncbi:TonB family protein [Roseovarius sp. SCSIO 43702]|uniref:energy transducer TonB n=1 Tax=Roseovarius sp. SCSIO 43702 TaxID=2823043 RepID=UPI001C72B29D|nr:energy transducer TonB [Roseovarius sp. SCSIO 43702]QYX55701.1 TonB family protein [Roseovarius sp. SCSIO 43702]
MTFGGLAVAAHLGAWAWHAGAGAGTPPAGDAGEAAVTLAAATGQVGALVERWSAPPDVAATVAMVEPPAMPQADDLEVSIPSHPAPEKSPTRPAAPALTDAPAEADDAPMTDTESIARPLSHAPLTSLRPEARPERRVAAPESGPGRAKPDRNDESTVTRARTATNAQTSSGRNNGAGSGTAQTASAPVLSQSQRQTLMAQWGGAIRHGVERRKRYPRGAAASGTTKLRITVSRQGRLLGVSVTQSSGDAALDRAAVDAVRRTRYPAAPNGLTQPSYSFNLPIAFQRG